MMMMIMIVTSEGDLDQCVKTQTRVYIFLKLCVDVEEKLGLFGVWDVCCKASYIVP